MKAMLRFVGISVMALLLCLTTACDRNLVFEEYHSLDGQVWNSRDLMKFNVDIENKNLPYNFYINVRVRSDYKYANMYLFLKTRYPNGKMSVDTVECYLADVEGRWLGERSGNSLDNRILLRKNLQFAESGRYSFEFVQAMRDTALQSVEEFGIRIETAL